MNSYNEQTRNSREVFFILFFIFVTLFTQAQTVDSKSTNEPARKVTLKFSLYSSDLDQRVHEAILKSELSTGFTCIPIGIVIVESQMPIDKMQIERIKSELSRVKDITEYSILELYSVADAEAECAAVRNSSK
ncbi:MAG: hypothetical protein PSX36_09780 [bacterium]|nr:hypothetical protein [bacterium]